MNYEIKNARIKSTQLGFDDHYTWWIYLSYGESAEQAFGGYALGGEYTDHVLRGILSAVNQGHTWEKLIGKPCRVKRDDTGKIVMIGHYLDDTWFDPRDYKEKD